MVGLIDCNNFFVSCERVFNPSLRNKPVIVFSNNDGCAVALSNEAKVLGIKRGDPYFKIRSICTANNVTTISGNHRLYGDMSSRIMAILSSIVPEIEIYSIDEAFLALDGIRQDELQKFGTEIVRRIRRDTGIPTSLGIAKTKTLAKTAAKFAKKYPAYHGCCLIDNDEKRRKALALTQVRDIWGIGRRLSRKLADYAIETGLQLADLQKDDVEKIMNITGIKTWMELNDVPCIGFENDDTPRKQMVCSRSFAKPVTEYEEALSIISAFASIAGRKLREHGQCAVSLSVFVHTDAFRQDLDQYYNTAHRILPEPTADTMTLSAYATECLASIFRKGFAYKKAGIIICELTDAACIQQSLFADAADRSRRNKLMTVIDNINRCSSSHDIVHTAAYRPIDNFVRREHSSRQFSTRLSDIITINCNYGL